MTRFEFLSIRMLIKKPRHAITMMLGIALGVAVIVAAFSLGEASVNQLSNSFQTMLGKADLVVSNNESFDQQVVDDALHGLPIERKAAELVYVARLKFKKKEVNSRINALNSNDIKGIWDIKVLKGQFGTTMNNLVLSNSLADQLKIEVGDEVKIFSGSGAIKKKVAGIISDIGLGSQGGAFMDLEEAQKTQGLSGKITAYFLKLTLGAKLSKVEKRLQQRLSSNYEVGKTPATGTFVLNMTDVIKKIMLAVGAFSIIVGIFLIYQTTYVTTTQRIPMLSLLKSFGATRNQLIKLFLLENLAIGIMASLIGLIIGTGLSFAISSTMGTMLAINKPTYHISPQLLIIAMFVGVGVSVVTTFIPTLKSAAMPAILGLREHPEAKAPVSKFISKFLTALLFNSSSSGNLLARKSIAYNWHRFRLITTALIITIAALVGIQIGLGAAQKSVSDYFNKNVHPETFFIRPQPNIGIGANSKIPISKINKIKSFKEAGDVSPYIFSFTKYKGKTVGYKICTKQEANNFIIEKGDFNLAKKRFYQGGWVVVTPNFLKNGMKIGGNIKVDIAGRSHIFKVAAVVSEAMDRILITWPDAIRYYGLNQVDEIAVKRATNTSTLNLKKRLQEYAKEQGYTLLTGKEVSGEFSGYIKNFSATLSILTSTILLIISMGIANMMMVNALTRVRLLGVIKSLGLKRRQLVNLLVKESLFIGIVSLIPGLIIGRIVGILFCNFITNAVGMTTTTANVFPTMLLAVIIVLTILYITALLPARKIGKIPVAQALRHE